LCPRYARATFIAAIPACRAALMPASRHGARLVVDGMDLARNTADRFHLLIRIRRTPIHDMKSSYGSGGWSCSFPERGDRNLPIKG
jgi:hypothetical protein